MQGLCVGANRDFLCVPYDKKLQGNITENKMAYYGTLYLLMPPLKNRLGQNKLAEKIGQDDLEL
jgi:hypothetical protein